MIPFLSSHLACHHLPRVARDSAAYLGVELSSLRLGGASHHAKTRHRHLAPIKARGPWHADCSVQRDKKQTRASNESPCSIPRRWPTERPSKNHFQHPFARPTLTPMSPDVGLCRPRSTSVPRPVRLSPRMDMVGRRIAALRIPLTELAHSFLPLLAGWMAAKMIRAILHACSK